jgi:hypothetical protein
MYFLSTDLLAHTPEIEMIMKSDYSARRILARPYFNVTPQSQHEDLKPFKNFCVGGVGVGLAQRGTKSESEPLPVLNRCWGFYSELVLGGLVGELKGNGTPGRSVTYLVDVRADLSAVPNSCRSALELYSAHLQISL